jgi:hypothetical protein
MPEDDELRKAEQELEEYDRDAREGRTRPDPAYRRALLMRIDMFREKADDRPSRQHP